MLDVILQFFAAYIIIWCVLSLAVSLTGADFVTSFTGVLTALSNVGPGMGDVIGPADNFKPLPDTAKWILSFAMLLGRLEIFTVLVLLSPAFWRE